MEQWRRDARNEASIVDLEALVPKAHLLRKIEKVMDYEWLYERLDPYYCHDNGRPGADPVVLIKMVLIQRLFGIPSLRQTHQRMLPNDIQARKAPEKASFSALATAFIRSSSGFTTCRS